MLRVPSGTVCIPINVNIALEAAAGTITEVDIRLAQNDVGNGTSSAATVGPIALRTDSTVVSNVVPRQLYTGDSTAETNPVSLYRKTFPLAQASGLIDYSVNWEPTYPAILVGPASLEVFIAATTTQATGFLTCTWMEWTSNMVTG